MSTQGLELRWCPAPVFKHLAGRFDKVAHGVGAVEAGVDCLRDQIVDAVAEFVEKRDDFVVLQQARFLLCWFGKVAYKRGGGIAFVAVGVNEALQKRQYVANICTDKKRTGWRLKLAAWPYFPSRGCKSRYRYPTNPLP